MKTRLSLVSNSSSSSFVIKKSDISYDDLKNLVAGTCYSIPSDDQEWVDTVLDDATLVTQEKLDTYYYVSTMSYADTYTADHFKLLKYFADHNIPDYVDTIHYRGDGRYDTDDEATALKNGNFDFLD